MTAPPGPQWNDTTERRGKNHTVRENVTRSGRAVALRSGVITTAARGQPAPTPPGSAPVALIAIADQLLGNRAVEDENRGPRHHEINLERDADAKQELQRNDVGEIEWHSD